MTAGPDDMRCDKDLYYATPEELRAIEEGVDAVKRGEIATDAEVEAVFARYRRA